MIPLIQQSPHSFTAHGSFLRLLTEINVSQYLYCVRMVSWLDKLSDEEAIVWEKKKTNNWLHFFSFLYITPASALAHQRCPFLTGIACPVWFLSLLQ